MVTAVANPDLTTVTPLATTVLRGDFDLNNFEMNYFNKKIGVGTAINRGFVLSRDNTVTPNVYKVAGAGDLRPLVVSGPASNTWDYVNPTQAASDSTARIQGITEAKVVLKAAGAIQPGQKVQAAANGEVVVWGGTAGQDCGTYIGLPGTWGGNTTAVACTTGDLIWVDFYGGAS